MSNCAVTFPSEWIVVACFGSRLPITPPRSHILSFSVLAIYRFTSVFIHSDVFLLCWHQCSTADCIGCLFCVHSGLLVFFKEVVGLAPQTTTPILVCRVVHGRYCACIKSNSIYNITSLCVVFVPSPTCVSRVEDYWEGYKLFCYAYYLHSLQHESAFKQSKLGSWFCPFFPPI